MHKPHIIDINNKNSILNSFYIDKNNKNFPYERL